jgi:outer membrane protein
MGRYSYYFDCPFLMRYHGADFQQWILEGTTIMRLMCALLVGLPLVVAAQDAPKTVAASEAGPPKVSEETSVEAVMQDVLKQMETYWAAEEAGPAEANALSLDVRQCVEMALANNPQVFVADDDVNAAKEKIGQAQSQRFPQVKGQIAYTYISGLKSFSLGNIGGGGILGCLIQDFMGSFSSLNSLQGKKEQRRDSIGITQVLYAGGQIQAAVKASKYLAESQEWRKQAKLNDLEFDVKSAYYGCLLARAMVRVAEESVMTFQRHLGDAQQMFDVGIVSNFEVLRAKTELGARQADAVAAKNAVRLALVNLRRILALPEDMPIRLLGKIEWESMEAPVEDLVKEAQEKRPELIALEKGAAAAQQNIRRTKGQYLPRAAASADWVNIDGGGSMMPEGWTLSVGAQMDLFDGMRRKHEVGEAKAQKSSLEHQLEDVRRLVELDVRNAYIQMEDAMARIHQEKGTVELGREGHRLALLRFQEGVGTQLEVLDAELALTNAETLLVKAIHDYAVAHAAIEKAIARSWIKGKDETDSMEGATGSEE